MSFSIFTVTVKREAPLNFFFQVSVSGADFKRYKSFLSIFFFFIFLFFLEVFVGCLIGPRISDWVMGFLSFSRNWWVE